MLSQILTLSEVHQCQYTAVDNPKKLCLYVLTNRVYNCWHIGARLGKSFCRLLFVLTVRHDLIKKDLRP